MDEQKAQQIRSDEVAKTMGQLALMLSQANGNVAVLAALNAELEAKVKELTPPEPLAAVQNEHAA